MSSGKHRRLGSVLVDARVRLTPAICAGERLVGWRQAAVVCPPSTIGRLPLLSAVSFRSQTCIVAMKYFPR
eukprot:scaffold84080_cov51-Phaeocystis_antarctica.AAC.1